MTYDFLIFHLEGELLFGYIGVGDKHLHNCFGISLHVSFPNVRIWTFQFGDHIKALCQLSKHVNNRHTEQGMFRTPLELQTNTCVTFIYQLLQLVSVRTQSKRSHFHVYNRSWNPRRLIWLPNKPISN